MEGENYAGTKYDRLFVPGKPNFDELPLDGFSSHTSMA
jgi:hypothetical protein